MFFKPIRAAVHTTLADTLAAGFAATAQAQDTYPERTVKVIAALPAGGSADMIAHVVGQKLARPRCPSSTSSSRRCAGHQAACRAGQGRRHSAAITHPGCG